MSYSSLMEAKKNKTKRTADRIIEIVATVWLTKDNTKYILTKKEINAEKKTILPKANEKSLVAFRVQHKAKNRKNMQENESEPVKTSIVEGSTLSFIWKTNKIAAKDIPDRRVEISVNISFSISSLSNRSRRDKC